MSDLYDDSFALGPLPGAVPEGQDVVGHDPFNPPGQVGSDGPASVPSQAPAGGQLSEPTADRSPYPRQASYVPPREIRPPVSRPEAGRLLPAGSFPGGRARLVTTFAGAAALMVAGALFIGSLSTTDDSAGPFGDPADPFGSTVVDPIQGGMAPVPVLLPEWDVSGLRAITPDPHLSVRVGDMQVPPSRIPEPRAVTFRLTGDGAEHSYAVLRDGQELERMDTDAPLVTAQLDTAGSTLSIEVQSGVGRCEILTAGTGEVIAQNLAFGPDSPCTYDPEMFTFD